MAQKDLDQQEMFALKRLITSLGSILIAGLLAAGLFVTPSLGAVNTQVQTIGYSDQGRYFAYEEYGTQEETGAAYSKIYLIDLVQVSHVVGTPIVYRGNIANQSLMQIRQKAHGDAQMFLQSLEIDQPAMIVAIYGDGHLDQEKQSLGFGVPGFGEQIRPLGNYQLNLTNFETAATAECENYSETAPLGFVLKIESFGAEREVYADKALPRSRQCPVEYEIYGVVMPFGATDISRSVGIISVLTQGPEGLSRYFIAIPLAFSL